MSSNIWTQCAGDSEIRPLRASAWRAVEAQHQVSTRKLVDTLEEQALLEDLIDHAKPPDPTLGKLHYLLATPFRYPPLRHGSRFGTRAERGIWYGSVERRTLFAEVAYYRFVFLAGTKADLGDVATQLTAFTARAQTRRGIDLTARPFAEHRAILASPMTYTQTQALGSIMRERKVELVRYPSARDVAGGVNIAVLSPNAFGAAKPQKLETWHCTANQERVELFKRDYFETLTFAYVRAEFLVDGLLPSPAM